MQPAVIIESVHHYRKTRHAYNRLSKGNLTADCPYPSCNGDSPQPYIFENNTLYIIQQLVPYDVFEGRDVEDHLMVIPKRHLESLADFTDQEMLDLMHVMADYEERGYNTYLRGVGGVRSVEHQHTHLIKIKNEKVKFVLYTRKPYIVIKI